MLLFSGMNVYLGDETIDDAAIMVRDKFVGRVCGDDGIVGKYMNDNLVFREEDDIFKFNRVYCGAYFDLGGIYPCSIYLYARMKYTYVVLGEKNIQVVSPFVVIIKRDKNNHYDVTLQCNRNDYDWIKDYGKLYAIRKPLMDLINSEDIGLDNYFGIIDSKNKLLKEAKEHLSKQGLVIR